MFAGREGNVEEGFELWGKNMLPHLAVGHESPCGAAVEARHDRPRFGKGRHNAVERFMLPSAQRLRSYSERIAHLGTFVELTVVTFIASKKRVGNSQLAHVCWKSFRNNSSKHIDMVVHGISGVNLKP